MTGNEPIIGPCSADPRKYLERYRGKRYPRLARSEMQHNPSEIPVRFQGGLLMTVAPLFGIDGLTPQDVASASRAVVVRSFPRAITGNSKPTPFSGPGLLTTLGIDTLRVSRSIQPDVTAGAVNAGAGGLGMHVWYTATANRLLVTAIDVAAGRESADVVDPVMRGYDATLNEYRFAFLRGGLPFDCVISNRDGRWAPLLNARITVGKRFPRSLIVHVPESIHWKRPGLDMVAAADASDQNMLVGVSTGPLTIVEWDAVYETPAEAAAAILFGLPKTDAVEAAGDREPDFRLAPGRG
jgi:hypothetical protein